MKTYISVICLLINALFGMAQSCFQNPFDIYLANPDPKIETFNGTVSTGIYYPGYTTTSHSTVTSAYYQDVLSGTQLANIDNGNFSTCFNGINYNIIRLGDNVSGNSKSLIRFPIENNITLHFSVFISRNLAASGSDAQFIIRQKPSTGANHTDLLTYNSTTFKYINLTTDLRRFDFTINILNCAQTFCTTFEIEALDGDNTSTGFCYAYFGVGPYQYNNQPYPVVKLNNCDLSIAKPASLTIQTNKNYYDLKWFRDGVATPLCANKCASTYTVTDYGVYYAKYKIDGCDYFEYFSIGCDNTEPQLAGSIPCTNCIPSFSPEPGKKYIVNAWVSQSNYNASSTATFSSAAIAINFLDGDNLEIKPIPGISTQYFTSGKIIDGWQRIDGEFLIPSNCAKLSIELLNLDENNVEVYFDDIRIQPLNSTMKSFVYDPANLKLVAELDENNYATFYEYDEEGQLIRIKKETERGISTIKETRNKIRVK